LFKLLALFTTNYYERYFDVRELQDCVVFEWRCISGL